MSIGTLFQEDNMNNIKFPWASQFIAHHKSHIGHNIVASSVSHTIKRDFDLRRELSCAFGWGDTHEGYDYWKTIAKSR